MNLSNFNFYDAFGFDDDTHVFAFQVFTSLWFFLLYGHLNSSMLNYQLID